MRLKTKLVLAITALVLLISGLLSLVYVSQLVHAAVKQSCESDEMVAEQVRMAVENALKAGLANRTVDPDHPEQLHDLTVEAIRNSQLLNSVIESINRYSPTIYDVNIADASGQTILSTNPTNENNPLPSRPDYHQLLLSNSYRLLRVVFGAPQVYDITKPLDRNGQPYISVHVGMRTTFLRAVYHPWLVEATSLMCTALVVALIVALVLSNFALHPLEEISMQLDYWVSPSEEESGPNKAVPEQDTPARVSHQIERIGQRMRDVEEVFSTLKVNLDQILGNLQDGLMLFTGDSRAVLVSDSVRRFLKLDPDSILGLPAHDIFDRNTILGRTIRESFDSHTALIQEEIRVESGRRLQASVHFIHDDDARHGLGALVTLRDLESVEAIESELEVSRRLSAIGRLTSGVAHEVKNPINAIVVHLELLRNKLGDSSPQSNRHLDVIQSEIHRLDRVVQTLVDFSRPVELRLEEYDLRTVLGEVAALAAEELFTRHVVLHSRVPTSAVMVNIDADLIKQALLNVIQNGGQAMPDGGKLEVILETDHKTAVLRVLDEGVGIPEEIREKIFDLYFTTKSEGSGIGLAMTYRILQLHHGSVEVQSRKDRGTEFRMHLPLAVIERNRRHLQPAGIEDEKGLG